MDAVTGATSYTGKYIARELLGRGREVRSLARRRDDSVFGGDVEQHALDFSRPRDLLESLQGCETLYITYWIRFPRNGIHYTEAVRNTGILVDAAARAGVSRIVYISVSNAGSTSPFPYFRGKSAGEEMVRSSGISHAIVRPTLVYGVEDILIHNIAWLLRHLPLFIVSGDGYYRTRPVFVGDVAQIAVDAAEQTENLVLDAAGPDVYTYDDLVRVIRTAVGSRSRVLHASPAIALVAARLMQAIVRDVIVTREELYGLMYEVVMSDAPPLGATRFEEWLSANSHDLGRSYRSELDRHWRDPRRV